MRVLVVEDDPGLQAQLKWAYEDFDVIIAGDRAAARATYEAALALIRQYAPRGDRKDWDQSAANIAAKLAKLPPP